MKKQYPYNILSSQVCANPKCNNKIKKRFEGTGHDRCYDCHKKAEAMRGHYIDHSPRKKRLESGMPVKNF